ncbi:MAG: type II secretion system protein [Planctomycetota bacterium]
MGRRSVNVECSTLLESTPGNRRGSIAAIVFFFFTSRREESYFAFSHRASNNHTRSQMVGTPQQSRSALTLVELIVVLVILIGLASLIIPTFTSTRESAEALATRASMGAVRDAVIQYWSDTKLLTLDSTTAATNTDTSSFSNTANRFQVRWLFLNPVNGTDAPNFNRDTRIGWNGPYLVESTVPLIEYIVDDTDGNHATGSNFSTVYGNNGGPAVWGAVRSNDAVIAGRRVPRALVVQAVDRLNGVIDCRVVSAGTNDRIDTPNNATAADIVASPGLTEDDLYVSFTLRY